MARWVRADLRARRGEALFLLLATAGVTMSLLLSGAFLAYGASPWQRVFTESNGAHIWIQTTTEADAGALAGLEGVESASRAFRTASATAELGGTRARIQLRGAGPEPPKVARPLITEGRWLQESDAAGTGRRTPAGTAAPDAGATSPHGGAGGAARTRYAWLPPSAPPRTRPRASCWRARWPAPCGRNPVTCCASTTPAAPRTPCASPASRNPPRRGTAPAAPPVSAGCCRTPCRTSSTRTTSSGRPSGCGSTTRRTPTSSSSARSPNSATTGSSPSPPGSRRAEEEAEGGGRLLGLLLGLFGLSALLAASLAVAGAISTSIRGHLRDIAILKAIGFTPGQLIRTFFLEHAALGLLGVACGALLTEFLGPRMPGRLGEAMRLWQALPAHAWVPLAIPLGALLLITGTTALAAWRVGRVPPVPVARPATPRRPPDARHRTARSRAAAAARARPRLAGRLPLPCAVLRRGRARLAVPLLLITIVLGAWTTLDRLEHNPEKVGIPAALTVRGDELDDAAVARMVARHPEVTAAYPGAEAKALVPGQTSTITLRGLGMDRDPYPLTIADGRAPHRSHEAVAGQGLLDLLDVRVGDWVRVTVGGRPQVLHLVGRSIEPEEDGRVISTTLDTLRAGGAAPHPGFYHLVLDQDADPPAAVAAGLSSAAEGPVDVREIPNPVHELLPVHGVLGGLVTVLALIGLAELSTTITAGVRDRRRDLLALRAIGLTPRQIIAVIVAGTSFTALAAALVGTAAGVLVSGWLIDLQGRSSGIGAGIAQHPPPAVLLLLVTAVVTGAVAVSLLPASRAVRQRLADTLGDSL